MYLAVERKQGAPEYFIRESYLEGQHWRSRDLVCLGPDPSRWVHYPAWNAYYIDPGIEEALAAKGNTPSQEELEEVFWRFLSPEVRRTIRRFHRRGRAEPFKRCSGPDLAELQKGIHPFDKRRLFMLRYGAASAKKIPMSPLRLFNRLLQKSRDEIEQLLEEMECSLRPAERKGYVYGIFDLQRFFPSPLAVPYPQAMDPDTMDEAFLAEVCQLQGDPHLEYASAALGSLNPALIRYVIMYFDHEFLAPDLERAYIEDFVRRHRAYREPPPRRPRFSAEEACKMMVLSKEDFHRLTPKQLAQIYRKRALECHPDQGGSHEQFIRLTRAYRDLLLRKRPLPQ